MSRLQLPTEFPNPHHGAELDFRDPPLEVYVLALARVSLEGLGLVANVFRFVERRRLSVRSR